MRGRIARQRWEQGRLQEWQREFVLGAEELRSGFAEREPAIFCGRE